MEKAIQDGSLYGRMMKSIQTSHSIGNTLRMFKLPIILTDPLLYAGAIANFYWLTRTLERRVAEAAKASPTGLVSEIHAMIGINASAGYESDLAELYGSDVWETKAARVRTRATDSYCAELEDASDTQLVAAVFILYGALVVGGGKSTQRKVKRVFPRCEHKLFDVAENMVAARKRFRDAFSKLGEEHPELADELVSEAARFMALNNTVVLSCRCLPFWWWKAAAVAAVGVAATVMWLKGK